MSGSSSETRLRKNQSAEGPNPPKNSNTKGTKRMRLSLHACSCLVRFSLSPSIAADRGFAFTRAQTGLMRVRGWTLRRYHQNEDIMEQHVYTYGVRLLDDQANRNRAHADQDSTRGTKTSEKFEKNIEPRTLMMVKNANAVNPLTGLLVTSSSVNASGFLRALFLLHSEACFPV